VAHPPEVKAAVMAALLAGQGVSAVAREYKLSHQLVSQWRASLTPEQFAEICLKRGATIDNLIFDYLQTNLEALQAQARVASTDEYIAKQPANELAILHGVLADKCIRILEAHENAFGSGNTPSAAPGPASG